MKGTVVLVDDDALLMRFYMDALEEEGFKVEPFYGPQTALDFARTADKESINLVAIVLDIMMIPTGEYLGKPTHDGLATGVFVFEDLKNIWQDVPIIVLTHVDSHHILDQFPKGPHSAVIQKLDYPPQALAQMINSLWEHGRLPMDVLM